MAASGVKASMQLETYKIDHMEFNVKETLGILASNSHVDCEVNFKFAFRDVYKYKIEEKETYVTGLKIDLTIVSKQNPNQLVATGSFVITGLFYITNKIDKNIEEKLLKFQAPAILFPYLRAAISFTLTSAGFSTIILPLVNVNAVAQTTDLKIIEK